MEVDSLPKALDRHCVVGAPAATSSRKFQSDRGLHPAGWDEMTDDGNPFLQALSDFVNDDTLSRNAIIFLRLRKMQNKYA